MFEGMPKKSEELLIEGGADRHGSIEEPSLSEQMKEFSSSFSSKEAKEKFAEIIEKVARLEKESRTDSLTGLLNRKGFSEEIRLLEAVFHRGQEKEMRKASTLLAMDLDGFKEVNDSCGHACGDFCLKLIAEKVRGVLRESDIFSRVGGDEFSIYLAQDDEEGALKVTEKVRLIIETEVTDTLRKEFPSYNELHKKEQDRRKVSASIGVLTIDENGMSGTETMLDSKGDLIVEKIMKYADYIAYAVKAAGKQGDFTFADVQSLDKDGQFKRDFIAGKPLSR